MLFFTSISTSSPDESASSNVIVARGGGFCGKVRQAQYICISYFVKNVHCRKFFFISIFLFVVLEDKPMAIVQNIATNLFLLFTISPISCVVRGLKLLFKQLDLNKDVLVSQHFQRNNPTLISIQASAIVIRTTTLSDTFSILAS